MSTKIEWVQNPDGTKGETWNVVTGCSPVSEGCRNCYARRMARRLAGRWGYPKAPHHFDVTLRPDRLGQPLRWKKPRRVFVVSMGDLFHDDVPFDFFIEVLNTIAKTPQHTYQFLTKRPARMMEHIRVVEDMQCDGFDSLFPNVWLGVTIEKPEYSYRAYYLRKTPAQVRFISFEPLLASFEDCPGVLDDIDWAIVGGETGPGARPMRLGWARGLRDQCQAADVPYFHKQNGEWVDYHNAPPQTRIEIDQGRYRDGYVGSAHVYRVGKKRAGYLLDGHEWRETPK